MIAIPEIGLNVILGNTFYRRIRVARRSSPSDPWEPVDLDGCEVEFSVGETYGKGTFQYRTGDAVPRVALESEVVGPVTWWFVRLNVEAVETRKWKKVTVFELTATYPDHVDPQFRTRRDIARGELEVHQEVAE